MTKKGDVVLKTLLVILTEM